ncbi:MAG: hypothetical protein KDD78_03640 [Caldilineaceae bacterium]|nr:hypothetical protein [Caldilineaceae bacterium]
MTIDQRNQLADEPFSYRTTKAGTVFISWQGKQVTVLQGKAAATFLARINGLEGQAAQLIMAKVTGNFKRGNERRGNQRG